MNVFTVNGNEYKAADFDFNLICDLEDMGYPLEQVQDKPVSTLRAYFALCAGVSIADAGNEIGEHLKNGGKMDDVLNAMKKAMDESDFFRNVNQTEEKKTTKTPRKATTQK